MMLNRVTYRDVRRACADYNKALKLKTAMEPGYLHFADIKGDRPGHHPRLYVTVNENGGVGVSDLRRSTMRKTIAAIKEAAFCDLSQSYQLIIRATWERGERQTCALREMRRRGLWLSRDQRVQAGLEPVEVTSSEESDNVY